MRIAVVEDEPEFAAALNRLLTEAGHLVVNTANGNAFLRLAKTETFDVILLDWNLPGSDGVDIVRNLRDEVRSDVPILLLTARSDADDIVAGLDAGADDYVVTPVDGRIGGARHGLSRRLPRGAVGQPREVRMVPVTGAKLRL